MSTTDIAWAAGFLEGEGCFDDRGCPRVRVSQVQKWPVEKMVDLFGGNLRLRPAWKRGQPCWMYDLTGQGAVGLMMTVFVFLSPRRKAQVKETLDKWRSRKLGHTYGTPKSRRAS